MKIDLRRATAQDMEAVHALVYELAVYEKEPEAVLTTPLEFRRDYAAGKFQCIVAEMEGEVVGMVLFYEAYSTWKGNMLYLDDFVVRESHRRYGVGQLLFERFLQEAQDRGYRLVKWQVLDWNKPALAFYEKNKAIIEKEWWNGKIIF